MTYKPFASSSYLLGGGAAVVVVHSCICKVVVKEKKGPLPSAARVAGVDAMVRTCVLLHRRGGAGSERVPVKVQGATEEILGEGKGKAGRRLRGRRGRGNQRRPGCGTTTTVLYSDV